MHHYQNRRSATDGYSAVRSGVERTLRELDATLDEQTVHRLTLEAMSEYAVHFVPRYHDDRNRDQARDAVAKRFRSTDLARRLDNGYGF